MTQIPILPGAYGGRGIDSVTNKLYGTAISFDTLKIQEEAPGQQVDFTLESITSSRELLEKLDLAVTASFSAISWGVSAEFKLSKSQTVNNYYTYALTKVLVQNPPMLLRNPQLLPEAKELLIQKGWEDFAKSYGYEYIEGIITGGCYYGLIEIQTTNETEQQNVKAILGGHYNGFKCDSSFTHDLQEVCKSCAISVRVIQSGGNGEVIEKDLEGMINEAVNFTKIVKESPVPIAMIVNDYRSSVPIPLNVLDANNLAKINQKNILFEMAQLYLQLKDYRSNLQFVLSNLRKFDDYRDFDEEKLQQKRVVFQGSLEKTAKIMDEISCLSEIYTTNYHECKTYVLDESFEFITLPTIGGELMTIKQMEEKIAALESKFSEAFLTVKGAANEQAYIGGDGSGAPNPANMDVQMGSHNDGVENIHFYNTGSKRFMNIYSRNVCLSGDIALNGPANNVDRRDSNTIFCDKRLHITNEELLYLLSKAGVIVGKGQKGNGNLIVEGNTIVAGQLINSGGLEGRCPVIERGNTYVKPENALILFYKYSEDNWAGIGVDPGGKMWFKDNTSDNAKLLCEV